MRKRIIICSIAILIGLFPSSVYLAQTEPANWGSPKSVTWSPDGKILAVCSTNGLWMFDTTAFDKPPQKIRDTDKGCMQAAFSHDGTILATFGSHLSGDKESDRFATLWNLADRAVLKYFAWEELPCGCANSNISSLAFSFDDQSLVLGGAGGIQLWNIKANTRQIFRSENLTSWRVVTFSPDGNLVASIGVLGAGEPEIFNIYTNTVQLVNGGNYCGQPEDVSFSPDSKILGIAARNDVTLWNSKNGIKIATLPHSSYLDALVGIKFSVDGKTVVAIGDYAITRWDIKTLTKTVVKNPSVHNGYNFRGIAITRNLSLAAGINMWGGQISIWDTNSGRTKFALNNFASH